MIVPDVPLGSGINSLPIARFATERDEVAVGGQSVLAASGHFLLAAHNPPTSAVRALADAVRDHWSIENKVHWVRDVTYDEDRCQIHTGTGPQVMAALRNAAISVLRLTGTTNIATATRHHARDSRRPLHLLKIG